MFKAWVSSRGMLALLAVACVSSGTLPAAASPPGGSDLIIALGQYKRANYRLALQSFLAARAKGDKSPETYIHIAHCYSALGYRDLAYRAYQDIAQKFQGTPAAELATQCVIKLVKQPAAPNSAIQKPPVSKILTISPPLDPTASTLSMPAEERIPYTRQTGGHLYVKGAINGRGTDILFDTGAFKVVVGRDNLIALGIKPPDGPSKIIGAGAAGALRGWDMMLDVSIGRIQRHMQVQVLEGRQVMLLGQPFLEGIQYQIDNNASYLVFINSKDVQKSMSYDAIEIPFHMVSGNLMVEAKVNGVATEMNFDTGAPHCVFTQWSMGELGLKVVGRTEIRGAGGSSVPGYYCTADTIELGPIRKQALNVLVSPSCGHNVLGQEFFGHMKFIVDNGKQVIRFAR
jgi:clan AA aspartic protease (TIGR02281 family)